MKNIETLFFDESGTPAVLYEDGLFVVGGFSIRGDTNHILQEWEGFLSKNKLYGKKGKKYNGSDFLNFVEFMCKNKIIPITTHSRFNDNDLDLFNSKIRSHNKLAFENKKAHMYINRRDYFWAMQVAITIATSIISLIINRGVISEVKIAVDKFLQNKILHRYVGSALENMFKKSEIEKILKPQIEIYRNQPDMQNFLNNFESKGIFISVDWNMRGKFALLADVICSMYRRTLKGDSEVIPSWDIIKMCYEKEGKIPGCIGNDLTSSMKNVVKKPWIIKY